MLLHLQNPKHAQENKPEDPLEYLHQKFGDSMATPSATVNGPQKDVLIHDVTHRPQVAATLIPSVDKDIPPTQSQLSVVPINHQPRASSPASPSVAAPPAVRAPEAPAQTVPSSTAPALESLNTVLSAAPAAAERVVVTPSSMETPSVASLAPLAKQPSPQQAVANPQATAPATVAAGVTQGPAPVQ